MRDGATFQGQPDTPAQINMSRIKYLQFAKFFMFELSNYRFETTATIPDKPAGGVGTFSKVDRLKTSKVLHEA